MLWLPLACSPPPPRPPAPSSAPASTGDTAPAPTCADDPDRYDPIPGTAAEVRQPFGGRDVVCEAELPIADWCAAQRVWSDRYGGGCPSRDALAQDIEAGVVGAPDWTCTALFSPRRAECASDDGAWTVFLLHPAMFDAPSYEVYFDGAGALSAVHVDLEETYEGTCCTGSAGAESVWHRWYGPIPRALACEPAVDLTVPESTCY